MWVGLASATAVTFVVTKLDDTDDGVCNTDCSLREAGSAANSGDTVSFASDVRGVSTLALGDLVISRPPAILGPGANELTVSGGDTQRIFTITSSGALTASRLTFAHGKGQYYAPLGVEAAGVVLSSGDFAFTDCTFADNHADGRPNAQVVNDAGVAYSDGVNKTISFTRCLFKHNSAGGGACLDIDRAMLTIKDSTFTDNFGEFGPACVIANSSSFGTGRNRRMWPIRHSRKRGERGPSLLQACSRMQASPRSSPRSTTAPRRPPRRSPNGWACP